MTAPIQNQPPQPQGPANLLEYRAESIGLDAGLGDLEGARRFFEVTDRYGAALQAVHEAYRGGQAVDAAQQQEAQDAFTGLRTEVDERTFARIPQWLQEAVAANGGNALTADEEAEVIRQCRVDQMSMAIVSSAMGQEQRAPEQIRERGNAFTRGLGRVMGSRITRGLLYGAAGVGLVIGTLSGALLPMAVAGVVGGAASVGIRRGVRHIQGRNDAHAQREMRNTRGAVQGRNNYLLQAIEMPGQNEDAGTFFNRAHGTLFGAAVTERGRNRQQLVDMAAARRRVGAGQTLRDFGRGAFMAAGFSGLIHMDVDAIRGVADAGAGIGPEQAAQTEHMMIQSALNHGSNTQLHGIPGLETSNIYNLDTLAHDNPGTYAWDGAKHIIPGHESPAAVLKFLHGGEHAVQQAHASGLGINIDTVTQPDGDWFFKIKVTDPDGLVALHPNAEGGYDILPVAKGTIHGDAQSELFRFLAGGKLMTHDQAMAALAAKGQVTPGWLADRIGDAAGEVWGLGQPGLEDVAIGVAGGAVAAGTGRTLTSRNPQRGGTPTSAAMAAAEVQRRTQERAPRIQAYLQQPQTAAFVQALPRPNQLAFARMVNGMTGIQRAEAARMLALQADVVDELDDEDNA